MVASDTKVKGAKADASGPDASGPDARMSAKTSRGASRGASGGTKVTKSSPARSSSLGLPPAPTPEASLSRYLQDIRKYPMLPHEEEYMLAQAWREHDDRDAAHKMVTSHLRLVAKIAMGYRGYGLPVAELIAEGNIGLMQAVKRFEPERGFRLATYAMWWIRANIQEYILRSWSLVKIGTTAAQKKLFFKLRKLKGQIQAIDEGDMTPDQVEKIATALNVPEKDVVSMNPERAPAGRGRGGMAGLAGGRQRRSGNRAGGVGRVEPAPKVVDGRHGRPERAGKEDHHGAAPVGRSENIGRTVQ